MLSLKPRGPSQWGITCPLFKTLSYKLARLISLSYLGCWLLCQPDRATECPDVWLKVIPGCVCESVSEWDWHLSSLHWVKTDWPPQWGWALSNLMRSQIEQEDRGRENWVSLHDCFQIGTSAFRLRLVLTPWLFPVLGPSNWGWECATSSPGSPACRWQIAGLLSIHNGGSQFLISICACPTDLFL